MADKVNFFEGALDFLEKKLKSQEDVINNEETDEDIEVKERAESDSSYEKEAYGSSENKSSNSNVKVGEGPTAKEPGNTDWFPGVTTSDEKVRKNDADYKAYLQSMYSDLPMPNNLNKFASHNHIFTLGVLTNEELNNPDKTYMTSAPSIQILRSGGGQLNKPKTLLEEQSGLDLEYFIDNVDIQTYIAPNPKSRNTNFSNISFTVTEPYSMGQFLQTLQLGALEAGHTNYLEAPFVLMIEFIGWDTNGRRVRNNDRKVLPFKLYKIDFAVTAAGAEYAVGCSPYNDQALNDEVQELPIDVKLSGKDLREIIQTGVDSLATQINSELLTRLKKDPRRGDTDEYIFLFPKDKSSAASTAEFATDAQKDSAIINKYGDFTTSDLTPKQKEELQNDRIVRMDGPPHMQRVGYTDDTLGYRVKRNDLSEQIKKKLTADSFTNGIGKSKFFIGDPLDAGKKNFTVEQYAFNKETALFEKGRTKIDTAKREIIFAKGTKIQKVLEELVLLSQWGTENVELENKSKVPGMTEWFKIDTQLYQISNTAHEKIVGRHPRIYVYRVNQYAVHNHIITMPNQPPSSYDELMMQAAKKYDYIYTGQNAEVLDFDIEFKTAFYKSISPAYGEETASVDPANKADTSKSNTDKSLGDASSEHINKTGIHFNDDAQDSITAGTYEDAKTKVARSFNDALVNSDVDLIQGVLTIMGDPYFIADSGMGNFNAKATQYINVNSRGSVDHSSSQVDIILNFDTPLDINTMTGKYRFGSMATRRVGEFSGLYQVISVQNSFKNNQFVQELQIVKRPNFQSKADSTTDTQKLLEDKKKQNAKINAAIAKGDLVLAEELKADRNFDGQLSPSEKRVAQNAIDNAKRNKVIADSGSVT